MGFGYIAEKFELSSFFIVLCSHFSYVDTAERLELDRLLLWSSHQKIRFSKRTFSQRIVVKMSASTLPMNLGKAKKVWIWTMCKEVMTVAVERGWNTFIFSSDNRKLSNEWSCNNAALHLTCFYISMFLVLQYAQWIFLQLLH